MTSSAAVHETLSALLGQKRAPTQREITAAMAGDDRISTILWKTLSNICWISIANQLEQEEEQAIELEELISFVKCCLANWGCPIKGTSSVFSSKELLVVMGWLIAVTNSFARIAEKRFHSICESHSLKIPHPPVPPDCPAAAPIATISRYSALKPQEIKNLRTLLFEIGKLHSMENEVATAFDSYCRCVHSVQDSKGNSTTTNVPSLSIFESLLLNSSVENIENVLRCSNAIRQSDSEWRKIEASFFAFMDQLLIDFPSQQKQTEEQQQGSLELQSKLWKLIENIQQKGQENNSLLEIPIIHCVRKRSSNGDSEITQEISRLEKINESLQSEIDSFHSQIDSRLLPMLEPFQSQIEIQK